LSLILSIAIDKDGSVFAQPAARADPAIASSLRQVQVHSATPRQKPRGPVTIIWGSNHDAHQAAARTLPTQFMKTEIIGGAAHVWHAREANGRRNLTRQANPKMAAL
jgi:hypothetical protein